MNKLKKVRLFLAATTIGFSLQSAHAVTNFEADVTTAIDRGIASLDARGYFNNPSTAADAAGLPMEALLAKRASGDPTDPAQGYTGASAIDQGRLRTVATYIINRVSATGTGFYAYRDGGFMFALSNYATTGGPDKSVLGTPITLKQAMDILVDRTLANQRKAPAYPNAIDQGYWCYTNSGCEDSSTTQYTVAGLAAAKAFYTSGESGDSAFNDATRSANIDTALALARQAYELNASQGSDNASCNILSATERGHGYRVGYKPSLQQTASGIYIQLFGGANVNTPMVQNYLEWEHNRYRWQDLDNLGNSWPNSSYWYYLWSSFKGAELIKLSGIAPNPGNIDPKDLGNLPPADAPACVVRQENQDPATFPQVASFGAGGVGYYAGEPKGQYFDYAHQIISHQCADGSFACNNAPGSWNAASRDSYALLVLLRSTGGGCVDSDGDGVCDSEDNCPATPNPDQADADGDGVGDVCDNCVNNANPNQEDSDQDGIGDACEITKCDVDSSGVIDMTDIQAIYAALRQPALATPLMDYDDNGVVSITDARSCVLMCTNPRCAP